MGLLKPARNTQGFVKAGLLGFPASGKTYTASLAAIGIVKQLGTQKPVAFFDTESGSDYLLPMFQAEGVEVVAHKGRAFADLLTVGREASDGCSVLIVDSITHVWRELCDSYKKRFNTNKLKFHHWDAIKGEWRRWTDLYLNAPLHIIVCGRAGYEYEFQKDDEGNDELMKTGTKMRVESEFGFEPSLLIEAIREAKGTEAGAGWRHRMVVLKDRTNQIHGKHITFDTAPYVPGGYVKVYDALFRPIVTRLSDPTEHMALDTTRTSENQFTPSGDNSYQEMQQRRTIAGEEISGVMTQLWAGQDATSKKIRQAVLKELFKTYSWSQVMALDLVTLDESVLVLRRLEDAIAQGGFACPDSVEAAVAAIVITRDELRTEKNAAQAVAEEVF